MAPEHPTGTDEAERRRRRRAAELLGETVPRTSADELAREEEMRRDVPPHHG